MHQPFKKPAARRLLTLRVGNSTSCPLEDVRHSPEETLRATAWKPTAHAHLLRVHRHGGVEAAYPLCEKLCRSRPAIHENFRTKARNRRLPPRHSNRWVSTDLCATCHPSRTLLESVAKSRTSSACANPQYTQGISPREGRENPAFRQVDDAPVSCTAGNARSCAIRGAECFSLPPVDYETQPVSQLRATTALGHMLIDTRNIIGIGYRVNSFLRQFPRNPRRFYKKSTNSYKSDDSIMNILKLAHSANWFSGEIGSRRACSAFVNSRARLFSEQRLKTFPS